MKTLITLGVAAVVVTTSILFANAGGGASAAPALDGFTVGDARYAVEARFTLETDSSGSQALVLDVVSTSMRLAPVFIDARKPMFADVKVDGALVLQAQDVNGVLRGSIPKATYQQWLGSEHDFELEVRDGGNEVLLAADMLDSQINQ